MNHLYQNHYEDLQKSGLSDQMINDMGIVSMSGYDIYQRIYGSGDCPSKWNKANGYCIPYKDKGGNVTLVRYRMFWDSKDWENEPDLPKYLSPKDAKTQLYIPEGFYSLPKVGEYLIVTEGEKKAAKAVQEGYPCVALAGIDMWADSDSRKLEKDNYLSMTYSTRIMSSLYELTDKKKTIVLFDSDAEKKIQIQDSRRRLKDALLFQSTHWCRMMRMPIPKGKDNQKWGLDDLLCAGEKVLFEKELCSALKDDSQLMTPLFELPYLKKHGEIYSYYVPNQGKYEEYKMNSILKEVPSEDGNECEIKEVSSTKVWVSRVVHSVDGDGDTLYELTFVPHSESMPRTITGDSELISIANSKDDILAKKGAKVLPKYKSTLEEFLVDCQKHGIKNGKVKKAYGTRRRGWREEDEHLSDASYVMASRIITEKRTYAAEDPKNTMIPIDSGSDEALRQALKVHGDFYLWKQAITDHVLQSTLPTLIFGGGFAGLFRHWCSGSENFIMHIYGDSSAGKTTAIKAVASAWGNPKRLIDTWKATTNGLERKAVGRNDMCLFLDEAGMAEESELQAAIYAIGNGGEKMRATKDARERTTTKYNLVALSTGEKQLVRGSKFVGQEVRALELRVDIAGPLWRTIHSVQEAEAFSRVLDDNYGHAVEPMIRGMLGMIKKDKKAIQLLWTKRTDRIRSLVQDQLPQHVLRRIKHFGLCLTALEIFLRHVMEWSEIEIEDKMEELSETIVATMVQLDTDQFKQGEKIGILQHFVNQLSGSQSKFMIEGKGGPFPHDLHGSIEGKMVYCIPNKLGEMMKPYDNARLIQAAEGINALMTRQHGKRKTISHRLGSGRPDCYVFDLEKIEEVLYKDE